MAKNEFVGLKFDCSTNGTSVSSGLLAAGTPMEWAWDRKPKERARREKER